MAKQENSVNTENVEKDTLDGKAVDNTQTDNELPKRLTKMQIAQKIMTKKK